MNKRWYDNEKTEEYNALRAELISKQEQKRSVWLHMYILFISLYVLGFEFSRYLFLLTFFVLIPYQASINNLEWTTARISAYIRVFYEDKDSSQRWETMNALYPPYRKYFDLKAKGISFFLRSSGSIHLALLSSVSFAGSVLKDSFSTETGIFALSPMNLVLILISMLLLLVVINENRTSKQKCEPELVTIIEKFKQECDAQQSNTAP